MICGGIVLRIHIGAMNWTRSPQRHGGFGPVHFARFAPNVCCVKSGFRWAEHESFMKDKASPLLMPEALPADAPRGMVGNIKMERGPPRPVRSRRRSEVTP